MLSVRLTALKIPFQHWTLISLSNWQNHLFGTSQQQKTTPKEISKEWQTKVDIPWLEKWVTKKQGQKLVKISRIRISWPVDYAWLERI